MLPPIPALEDYDISPQNGFLPMVSPMASLPGSYYAQWETIVANLHALLLTKRIRQVVDALPVLSTERLVSEPEWRRAYVVLTFMANAYIWGGQGPSDRPPACISIPLLNVSDHLEVPPVATYASLCLWNYKLLSPNERIDTPENLSTLNTFTGLPDESWFYLVMVAIEARGAPLIQLMLNAVAAARKENTQAVAQCLCTFAERLKELEILLTRTYKACDPYIFCHRVGPFLAGSKNMGDAGLPEGVIYEDGSGQEKHRQYSGASSVQSSLVQFFDIILGIEQQSSREGRDEGFKTEGDTAPPSNHNSIQEMRSYIPGSHRRFLQHVSTVANIQGYVESRRQEGALCAGFDACVAMLHAFRNKHIQVASRYVVQLHEVHSSPRAMLSDSSPPPTSVAAITDAIRGARHDSKPTNKKVGQTGGKALMPFLQQAREETGEPTIDAWMRRLSGNEPHEPWARLSKTDEHTKGEGEAVGLASIWATDSNEGGLCRW
ncbi:MAG: hypothetical protein M1839_004193 [Geoglossum umbratile]|nr:MAG: hypothetical protein M1839_004193 [Geoglossum umbratile]